MSSSHPNSRSGIVRSAAKNFAKYGYEGTSLDQIAKQAGVHKSTLYHYIRSKKELLLDVLVTPLSECLQRLEAVLCDEGLDVRGQLEALLRIHLNFMFSHRDVFVIFVRERNALRGYRKARLYFEMIERYDQIFYGTMKEGIASGDFRETDPRVASLVLLGGCNWMVEWYKSTGRLSRHELEDTVVEFLLQSVLVPSQAGSLNRGEMAGKPTRS